MSDAKEAKAEKAARPARVFQFTTAQFPSVLHTYSSLAFTDKGGIPHGPVNKQLAVDQGSGRFTLPQDCPYYDEQLTAIQRRIREKGDCFDLADCSKEQIAAGKKVAAMKTQKSAQDQLQAVTLERDEANTLWESSREEAKAQEERIAELEEQLAEARKAAKK